jgi:SAM-dependent methyltransferase
MVRPHWKRLLAALGHRRRHTGPPRHRRLVGNLVAQRAAYLQGANDYVGQLAPDGVDYLYYKPFEAEPGHATFFLEMYQILNIIQTMALPAGGRVIEVGSGPGWVTEILSMLAYEVDAVEPSEAMIQVARERIASCQAHYRRRIPPRVRFHCQPFEDCELPDDAFDGVLFHESLHHMIDEERTLAIALRKLRPGGVIGISGECAWIPGEQAQEDFFRAETARYGTLESPFTREYIDYLLAKHGFEQITRHHGVNGLFDEGQGRMTIAQTARFPASAFNTITARKPGASHTVATTANGIGVLLAEIQVLEQACDVANNRIDVRVRLVNTGSTAWLHEPRSAGFVTLGLRQAQPGTADFRESLARRPLPRTVNSGDQIELEVTFELPDNTPEGTWEFDLIDEMVCWFSSRGTKPVQIHWPGR